MNQGQDGDLSVLEISDDHIRVPESDHRPPVTRQQLTRVSVNNLEKGSRPQARDINQEFMNILRRNNKTRKLDLNEAFPQLLNNEYPLKELIVVSIYGSRFNGKSFLADMLLSEYDGETLRVFSKVQNPGANIQLRKLKNSNQKPILIVDWLGFEKNMDELDEDVFLWMYMTSNVIIYNQLGYDQRSQENFQKLCQKTKQKVVSDDMDYARPTLAVIRRDIGKDAIRKDPLVSKIAELEMFEQQISELFLPYPGTARVNAKQLLDTPKVTLEPQFLRKIGSLQEIIRDSKPKYLNDCLVNSSILAILVGTYSHQINRNHKIVIEKCWEEVIETLSVGAYNYYILQYSEALQQEFKDEQPLDRYTLYKKLSKIKNQTSFKLQNFANVRGDRIFEKYKQKLNEVIKLKEDMIIQINHAKSVNANQGNLQAARNKYLRGGLSADDSQPLKNVLNDVVNGNLDDGKNEILQNGFKQIIGRDLKSMEAKADSATLKAQIKDSSAQVAHLKKQLEQQNDSIAKIDLNVQNIRAQQDKSMRKGKQYETQIQLLSKQQIALAQKIKQSVAQQSTIEQKQRDHIQTEYKSKLAAQTSEIEVLAVQLKETEKMRASLSKAERQKMDAVAIEQEKVDRLKASVLKTDKQRETNVVEIEKLKKAMEQKPVEPPKQKGKGCCVLI